MDLHVTHHFEPEFLGLVRRLVANTEVIRRLEGRILMNISDIQSKADQTLAQVQSDTNVANNVKAVVDTNNTLLSALKQQIADLQSANDPNALQKLSDTIDAIQATDLSNSQVVSAAVVAGTPVENQPPTSSTP